MEIKKIESKSIKNDLLIGILMILLVTLVILNLLIMFFIRKYYYDNTEDLLKSRMEVSVNFYEKYFSSVSLIENIYDNIDAFWNENNAQVEIFDSNGNLLMDSIGVREENLLKATDINKALNGEVSRWIGRVNYYDSKVMAVSYPLKVNNEVIGVIRFITSLEEVESVIKNIMVIFITISLLVLLIGIILSIILSNNIINPIKYLTNVAEKMANGNLDIRSNIDSKNEIGQLSNTLNFMVNEISKREQLKNEFISQVSHELRTPLTSIKGWAITLNDEETDKETLKIGFDIIEKETDRLTIMVEELLDFSRLINEKITLNLTKINNKEFLIQIKNLISQRAFKENISLNFNVIDEVIFLGDFNRLKQVFINILDNSLKFTNSNGNIKIISKKIDNNIKFIIEDNGCGISEEDLPKVKEKFFKGKNSKSQNGIGLSICDEIIKLHKGIFNIDSKLGIGTKIEIIIPNEEE